jgi:hypothetical protein
LNDAIGRQKFNRIFFYQIFFSRYHKPPASFLNAIENAIEKNVFQSHNRILSLHRESITSAL